jgi:hypothetical protein
MAKGIPAWRLHIPAGIIRVFAGVEELRVDTVLPYAPPFLRLAIEAHRKHGDTKGTAAQEFSSVD